MPVLDDLREKRTAVYTELKELAAVEKPTAEQNSRWSELDGQITELDTQIEMRSRQAEREQRAAADRASRDGGQTADITDGAPKKTGWSVGTEPTVYGRGSNHSYFLDLARRTLNRGDGDGGPTAASERLERHNREIEVEMPKRYEARNRAAAAAYDKAFAGGSDAEKRAYDRMARTGTTPFEKRFISRTDGAGGYFVPPVWLIDEYIPYLRVGRDFIDLWRGLPLPPGTDSINIPRVTVGTATGPQVTDGGTVPGRDMTDSFVNAPVRTIAGQQDAALQLLDQSPITFDEVIFQDLAADYNMQLSGQGLVGSGVGGQIAGIMPAGQLSANNSVYLASTNNAAAQTWVNGAGATPSVVGSVFQNSAQMLSIIARNRLLPPTHWVWHPWVWYMLTSQVDGQQRPLVVPGTPNNLAYNQVAVDNDGPAVMGPVGYYMGLPVILDPNVPVTFGGTTNPQISTISAGQFAPTPGSGTAALYTPLIVGRWNDCFLWEGEMRSRVLSEVLSGNLQVRFQVYNYVAAMTNRYQAYSQTSVSASYSSGGLSGGVNAGGAISYGVYTQMPATAANGVLNLTGQGF